MKDHEPGTKLRSYCRISLSGLVLFLPEHYFLKSYLRISRGVLQYKYMGCNYGIMENISTYRKLKNLSGVRADINKEVNS